MVELPKEAQAWASGITLSDSSLDDEPTWNKLIDTLSEAGLWHRWEGEILDVVLSPPTIDDTTSDVQRLSDALVAAMRAQGLVIKKRPLVPLELVRKLPNLLRDNHFRVRCLLRHTPLGARLIAVLPENSTEVPYGIACDVGTTGVSLILVDLMKGRALAEASAGNAQVRYGADVINRIVSQSRPGGIKRLQRAIVEETINPLIEAVCAHAGVASECISHMVIAGNTTMGHLLLGVEADPLRMEPYIPCFYDIEGLRAVDLGLAIAPFAPVFLAPNVGSYVGGDITSGLLASGLWQSEELKLFIDLGTNGELVFGNKEFLMTCACSAGPAFEGGDISCGMRATEGAIEAVSMDTNHEPRLTVIGGGAPTGICGSGLIDVVSELFRTGALNGKGRIVAEGRRFVRDEYGVGSYVVAFAEESTSGQPLTLNEVDIENFVRAKGAIFSAIMTMLSATGLTVDDLTSVQVAGGIGSHINIKNAISIGLFPDIPRSCYSYLGNTSLYGARAMTQSIKARAKVQDIAKQTTYLELSTEPGYMDSFIAACFIPHTDASLFPSSQQ